MALRFLWNSSLLIACCAIAGPVAAIPIPPPATMAVPALPVEATIVPPPAPAPTTKLVLSLRQRRVTVYRDNQAIASYPVGIGKPGWETPRGTFRITSKIVNPTWQHPWNGKLVPPGPNNPLGDRWIGFWSDGKNSIGFHGTTAESLIGQAVSHGCVRMKNRDIRALFELVEEGTLVSVQP
ncbi:L,D-transpeptidase [Synechococcus elongatus]|uniref:L,D-transpeptidase n=1 Tax=Synechococcus elongatus PCC 11802 TaxID=2283154 RepID=A0AAT9JX67_SYNEL|nr:L,D-transpeptidase [Synechococcus elongatus]QFZ93176.1 L,D-transpeptidase [Synechococcus elongatus PCC 11802]